MGFKDWYIMKHGAYPTGEPSENIAITFAKLMDGMAEYVDTILEQRTNKSLAGPKNEEIDPLDIITD